MKRKRTLSERESRETPSQATPTKSFPADTFTRFNRKFPYFRKPDEIGHFSQNCNRTFQNDDSQLKYYCCPDNIERVHYDLRHGYEHWQQRDESIKEYLDDLLRWINLNRQKFIPHKLKESNPKSLFTDFVCWRGLLTKLLCTPYERRDGWKIAVTLLDNTLYMCEYETEQKRHQKETETPRQREMGFGGYKFEQWVTSDNPKDEPDTKKPVNNNEAYVTVVRSRLGKHSLVLGGEVDCCEKEDRQKYIELKTSREMDRPNQVKNFKRFKVIKWWAQSFLVGIENVICGFRDDDGIVRRLETFPTATMPRYCRDIIDPWEPTVCFNFLEEFLHYVKQVVTEDNPRVAYVFSWMPREDVQCLKYGEDSQDYKFLPKWFVNRDGVESE